MKLHNKLSSVKTVWKVDVSYKCCSAYFASPLVTEGLSV